MEINDQNLKEYFVTLITFEVIDNFRDDMETPGGDLYIPDRLVECCNYGPISRTLHYMLNAEEADLIANDPRVAGVELNFKDDGIEIMPLNVSRQTSSNWDLSATLSNTMLNWGLLRCSRPRPTLNAGDVYPNAFGPLSTQSFFNSRPVGFTFLPWDTLKMTTRTGSGWTTAPGYWDIPGAVAKAGKSWGDYGGSGYYNTSIAATVELNATGKNVDVVVVDGGIVDRAHPEFAKNPDGSGGSRCITYNWYQHNTEVGNGPNGTYDYSGNGTSMFGHKLQVNSHALHCTGTATGITQGWARESNIYNITFFEPKVIDYVRAFHKNKPINPITKRKNPTICTNSWGTFGGAIKPQNISSVNFRGTTFSPPYTAAQLHNWGIYTDYYSVGTRSAAIDASVADAIKEGIIFVAAAGNSSFKNDVDGGPDSNNTVTVSFAGSGFLRTGVWKYNYGLSPGNAVDSSIRLCIGALDTTPWDSKAAFSNCGPAVDFYAPGVSIISAYDNSPNVVPAVTDRRSSSHYLQKLQGTSMATPQVAGISACVMETNPHWTNKQLKEYLIKISETNKIAATTLSYAPGYVWAHRDIQGSPNRIAKFVQQRTTTGILWPKSNVNAKPPMGRIFPRPRFGKR
jgi:hypothetical protein